MLQSLVLIAGLGLVPKLDVPVPVPVTIVASDGATIAADVSTNPDPASPVILLFHQAGSGKGEYAPISPRLLVAGYSTIALDRRSVKLARSAHDLDVLRDMDATLAYAKREFPRAPIYAWGSGSSASLVFALAARHPHEIAAVLAFSPGEYFTNKRFVRSAAREVRVPVFIDSASDPAEERAAREIAAEVRSPIVVDYVPHEGVRGSATLRDDRDAAGAAENWDAVMAFLARVRSTH